MRVTHSFVSAKSDPADLTLVKPSNWNDEHVVSGFTEAYLNAYDYNFTALTNITDFTCPGNALAIGSNTLTLLGDCPLGVNGTDTGHYLYVSGGTGTAEACLITGGTALSGVSGGTLIITCAATHSGAFTLQSATAGVQEAQNACSGAIMQVFIPAGIWTFYAPVYIDKSTRIFGAGQHVTFIYVGLTGGAFDVHIDYTFSFSEFSIQSGGIQQTGSGGYGIKVNGSIAGSFNDNFYGSFYHLYFYNIYTPILFEKGYAWSIKDCKFTNFANAGLVVDNGVGNDAGAGSVIGCQFDFFTGAVTPPNGISLISTGGMNVSGCSFGGMGWALRKTTIASSGLMFIGNDVENTRIGGIRIDNAFDRVVIQGNNFSQYDVVTGWYGIFFDYCLGATVNGNHFLTVNLDSVGVYVGASSVEIVVSGNLFRGFFYSVQSDGECSVGVNRIVSVAAGGQKVALSAASIVALTDGGIAYSGIGGWKDGSVVYVTDGTVTSGADNTLTSGGTGALAVRINGVWRAFKAQN